MDAFNGNVIDIEASGLGSFSYPIEVGVVLSNGQTYEALIQPRSNWRHWDANAEKIHGISRATLATQGRSVETVCAELNSFCAGKILYSDCWVHDSRWLNMLFAEGGVAPRFHCSAIESIVREEKLAHWMQYKHAFARSAQIPPHRALNDAIIISETLERLTVNEPEIEPDLSTFLSQYAIRSLSYG